MTKAFDLIPHVEQHEVQDSTKITAFMTCPRRYFYEYVLGWRPETPNNHLVFGSAWHKAMEVLAEHGYSVESLMAAHEAFLKEYRKVFPPETDELFHPKTPDNAMLVLAKYAQRYAADFKKFEVLHIEVGGRIAINDDQNVYFKMDTICRDPQSVFSLEHKTCSSFYLWDMQWPLSMQIGTYTHVLFCMYPEAAKVGIKVNGVMFGKSDKPWQELLTHGDNKKYKPPYDFNRFEATRNRAQMHSWLWTVQYWLDQIEANFRWLEDCSPDDPVLTAFPMNSTNCTKYNGCPWFDFCNAWQNPLARCEQPPIGYEVEHWDPRAEEVKTHVDINKGEVNLL